LKCLESVPVKCKNDIHTLTRPCWNRRTPQCRQIVEVKCRNDIHDVKKVCGVAVTKKCTEQVLQACSAGHQFPVDCCKSRGDMDAICNTCTRVKGSSLKNSEKEKKQLSVASARAEDAQVKLALKEKEFKHKQKLDGIKKIERDAKEDTDTMIQYIAQESSSLPSRQPQKINRNEPQETKLKPKTNYNNSDPPARGHSLPEQNIPTPSRPHLDSNTLVAPQQDEHPEAKKCGNLEQKRILKTPLKASEAEIQYYQSLMECIENEQWEELCTRCGESGIDTPAIQALKVYASYMEFDDKAEAREEFEDIPKVQDRNSDNIADLILACVEMVISDKPKIAHLIRLQKKLLDANFSFPPVFNQHIDDGISELTNERVSKARPVVDSLSTAKERWLRICKSDQVATQDTPSEAIDTLMDMVGLESVKEKFLDIYDSVKLAIEKDSQNASSYNIRCDGNPGIFFLVFLNLVYLLLHLSLL
jgi:hypothetical protein